MKSKTLTTLQKNIGYVVYIANAISVSAPVWSNIIFKILIVKIKTLLANSFSYSLFKMSLLVVTWANWSLFWIN